MSSKLAMIFLPEQRNARQGGPSGFVAQNLAGHELKYAQLSTDHLAPERLLARVMRRIRRAIGAGLRDGIPDYYRGPRTLARRLFTQERVWEYPLVMFHEPLHMFYCQDLIGAKQTVILQPHYPERPGNELAAYEHGTPEIIRWVEDRVVPATFGRADFIVLPNEGAARIYDGMIQDRSKIIYLPSGSKAPQDVSPIPLDPRHLYFLYVGRRIPIKGYDLVVEGFRRAHAQRPELRLILLGNGKKADIDGVIDVGFSTKPHDWMTSVDYVINANRQSYFDLTVLETLAVGAPLLLSCTWGHAVFKGASKGVFDIGEANIENIEKAFLAACFKRELDASAGPANRELFLRRYSDDIYRANLDHLLFELGQARGAAAPSRRSSDDANTRS
jgi:glycosyltransferase involved in cell wall biosynthesis